LRKDNAPETNKKISDHRLEDPEKLFKMADDYRERGRNSPISDQNKWVKRAEELEEKAHDIVSGKRNG